LIPFCFIFPTTLPQCFFSIIYIDCIDTGFVEHKFTIRFTTNTGKKISIGSRTVEEIVTELRERALVCTSRGVSETLSIIINAFINDNKIKIDDEIEAPGVYYINSKLRCYPLNYKRQPSKHSRERKRKLWRVKYRYVSIQLEDQL